MSYTKHMNSCDILNLKNLFDNFHMSDIQYCHFKSNEHVEAGLYGDTDLDILIDKKNYVECVGFLNASGFKRFTTSSLISYPSVEDWLGFDNETGKLTHLHLHWQMVAGEPSLKGYHLPWEKPILDSRIWNEEHGIFISSPEMELVLLLVRAALKFRTRDFVKQLFGKLYPLPKSDIFREFDWLIERADVAKVRDLAARLMSSHVANQIDKILQKGLSDKRSFYDFRGAVLKELKSYKTYNFLGGRLYRWSREFAYRGLSFMATRFGMLSARRRVPATGGLIITFLGADGSGKSTQASDVVKWLGWKADVAFIYFGSGDGPASPLRKLVMNIKRIIGSIFVKPKEKYTSSIHSERNSSSQSTFGRLFFAVWALSLAFEKYCRLIKATRARNKGMIIVCDRYPQNQIEGFNDGPLLAKWKNDGWLWQQVSEFEQKWYTMAEFLTPDVVFKLNVSEHVAAQRKTDTPAHMITRKINAVQQLTFHQSCKVFEINADDNLDSVTLVVRRTIWNAL